MGEERHFSWVPMYAELADAVLAYRDRQEELINVILAQRDAGLPALPLEDRYGDGSRGPLRAIDPFTFFANFNRGVTDANRTALLADLKGAFGLRSEPPTDFSGIPVVNNQRAWFIGYEGRRGPDDVDTLWTIADAARRIGMDGIDPKLFAAALDVRGVGPAKLTMGLFWFNPDEFIALDRFMRDYIEAAGVIAPSGRKITLKDYRQVVAEVRERVSSDFKQVSRDAWVEPSRPKRYWAGGFLWGGSGSKLDEFLTGDYWQHGYDRSSPRASGKRTWELFDQVREGDEFAIKGYGGRNDLRVHYLGEVTHVDPDEGKISMRKKSGPLYQGKAPKGARPGWFQTLTEVRDQPAVDAIFHGRVVEPPPDPGPSPPQPVDLPLNCILFGPPGTGKTYRMLQWANAYFSDPGATDDDDFASVAQETPLWQLVAAALLDVGKSSVNEILEHPLIVAKRETSSGKNFRAHIWGNLQVHTPLECEHVKYARRRDPAVFWKDADSRWSVDRDAVEEGIPEVLDIAPRPSQGGQAPRRRYEFVTFHQSYSYEDFIEGIRPDIDAEDGDLSYRVQPGVFRRIVQRAASDPDGAPYAIFIDEINRANISKVFGELMTLLEEDKRAGEPNECAVQLPYSGETFRVPSNLWVIGSMNTADRSIALLDTALRRRFDFEELLPDASVVRGVVEEDGVIEGVDVAGIMEAMNDRIEYLYSRDHMLGHSYFLDVASLDGLRSVFIDRVIPLLQEYFYDDWEKTCQVLGCPGDVHGAASNSRPLIERRSLDAASLFGQGHDGLGDERYRYEVSRSFRSAQGGDLADYFQGVASLEGEPQ